MTIPDPEVSRRHASISAAQGVLEIRDLGSENGTHVNGKRIEEPTALSSGDTITIGRTKFIVFGAPPSQDTAKLLSPAESLVLHFKDGSLAGRRVPVLTESVLGRERADIVIEDPGVSRRHASVRPLADGLEIRDLQSANGTWVNGDRVDGARALVPGDVIKIGNATIEVATAAPASQPTMRAPAWQAPEDAPGSAS